MVSKFLMGVVGLASFVAVGTASASEPVSAAEPMVLSVSQMDGVTAGWHSSPDVQINKAIQTNVAVVLASGYFVIDQTNVALQVNK